GAEAHPPQATAASSSGGGAIVSSGPGATPVPATKADVYVSPYAGGAGDACVLAHQADPLHLLGIECFPLAQPVAPINAQDFAFDLPMPPRPVGGRPRWRIIPLPAPGGTAARVRVGPVKSWVMQAAINGEWQELTGLDTVNTSDVIPQALVYDQYLPATGAVHLEAAGAAHECVDTLYGKSLATDLGQLGFTKGLACLNATAHPPGTLDLTYAGPDFGAGG